MLEELSIRALGVIDEVTLPLGPGLTVLTGETGAGKTMVLSALALLFGGRADSALVRTGTDQASVEGRVEVADPAVSTRVSDAGGVLDDERILILRRSVSAAGRSRAAVGGSSAPVAVLGELGERLLAVHGQSDQLRLTRPAAQRELLDRFAGVDAGAFATALRDWTDARDALAGRLGQLAQLRRESELLTFGMDEIDAAALQPGEDQDLIARINRLSQIDALRMAAAAGHDALLGEDIDVDTATTSVRVLLGEARRAVAAANVEDPVLDALAGRLVEVGELADDLGRDFARYGESLQADPDLLESLQQRRAVLQALERKYAETEPGVTGVLAWRRAAAARLADIDVSDEAIAVLTADRDAAALRLCERAAELSETRRAAAADLAERITGELAGLAMSGTRFCIDVRPRSTGDELADGLRVGSDGADEVEFGLRTAAGQAVRPLGRTASGGELARVMLALEVCLAGTDPVPTMVFDEVDAGVGGRAAVEVGARLARLAQSCQVIVVTHLAQVAAFADTHVVVDKSPGHGSGGVTTSDVGPVEGARRITELARMLGGSDTAAARRHAEELLAAAAVPARPGEP